MRLLRVDQKEGNELVGSMTEVYPQEYRRVPIERGNYSGIVRVPKGDKVSIVVGAGSGNEPWCGGYVGEGLADGAVAGPFYTAPSARAVLAVTRNVPNRQGVVYICTNHAGDVLNFELASELAELEGIHTATIKVTDDAASAPASEREERRGIAGVLLVVKAAAGAAALGMSLDSTARIAAKANDHVTTFNVYFSSIRDPESGEVLIRLEEGMVDYGGGFNGEKGAFRRPFVSLEDTVDTMVRFLLKEFQPLPSSELVILVNGSARITFVEMTAIARRVLWNMRLNEIKVHRILTEHAFSSQENDGFSISIMSVDKELKRCMDVPAWTPYIHGFARHGEM